LPQLENASKARLFILSSKAPGVPYLAICFILKGKVLHNISLPLLIPYRSPMGTGGNRNSNRNRSAVRRATRRPHSTECTAQYSLYAVPYLYQPTMIRRCRASYRAFVFAATHHAHHTAQPTTVHFLLLLLVLLLGNLHSAALDYHYCYEYCDTHIRINISFLLIQACDNSGYGHGNRPK
jgi:hypothetical protein